jgi:Domain of unknown function (4846)
MPFKPATIFCVLICCACNNAATAPVNKIKTNESTANISTDKNPYHSINAIPLPDGYERVKTGSHSFAAWLQKVSLKENKTVFLFNGAEKINQQAQFAVLDISVGNKNLQQCADAVMRLRAEYLFAEKRFDEIIFTDNEQGNYSFTSPFTKENFVKFMERVFGMCGSASLSKQLKRVINFSAIQAGDVLIRGGFPGHAVMVMNVAENRAGKKIFLLAQSYMPAQDIHVLINPSHENLSPWYEINNTDKIITPEYIFYKNELKKW